MDECCYDRCFESISGNSLNDLKEDASGERLASKANVDGSIPSFGDNNQS